MTYPAANIHNDTIPAQTLGNRLTSVDTLRGFTMFFIIGGERIFTSVYQVWPNSITETLAKNMEHAGWEGFYFYDQIFPLFLFLVGLLIPTVILRSKEKGKTNKEIFLHISKRTIVLILLGLANYGLLRFDWPAMRWSSVLGRIGICYFFASLLVLHSNWRIQTYVILAILIGYWAAVRFIPVPGYGPGVLTPEGCLTTWLDQKIIPGTLGLGIYDRQGVLSTFTALASTLIGVLAGHWLRTKRTENQKTSRIHSSRDNLPDCWLGMGSVFLYQQECMDKFICSLYIRMESAFNGAFLLDN